MKKWLGIAILFIVLAASGWLIQSWMMPQTVTSWNTPLSGKVIILDPGHGGVDGGASTRGEEILEKDVALSISFMLRDYLQEAGALVLMTREGDYDLAGSDVKGYSRRKTEDLHKRLDIVNESGGDLFLSLHLNAVPSTRWSGAQTFYQPSVPENETLARLIQTEMREVLERTTRETKGIREIFLLNQADIPGALVEAGFLSHPEEGRLLGKKEHQNKIAVSIYRGILRYYGGEEPEAL
ncbi:N-acetylmuramoyl-L-alanine amidase CwlD [Salibacterium qingdaonense]|uniref:N-acetylmuramoyl-L-alanine amidase n=1 Tax=Salibacterium qingdaonense TaxID=266892 RepID=A0A1I4PB64_9BACI|nr:N-acetylmuramoyl-L-alanine amidase CwlD [Salibacterium qingdaonense]SFM25001.1 N-acetylmuramoyl-L-alanine amidase [Salibacterium qingdaonense]